jgi:hypothetical protein
MFITTNSIRAVLIVSLCAGTAAAALAADSPANQGAAVPDFTIDSKIGLAHGGR